MDELSARTQPVEFPSPTALGRRLRAAGQMIGIEYPWSPTSKPSSSTASRIPDVQDEPEVLEDDARDLVDIFGAP